MFMLLITGCADYQPLYSGDKSNFSIGKIDYKGQDVEIAKKIGKNLRNIIRSENNAKKININNNQTRENYLKNQL